MGKIIKMNYELENLKRENTRLKGMQEESVSLLKQCQKQVGTVLGEQIAEHISHTKGIRHNSSDWDMSDRNGEQ